MLGQSHGSHGREGHSPATGLGLGQAGEELAVDLGHLLSHGYPATEQIDALDAQADQLAPAQATIAQVADQAHHGIQRVCDSESLVVGFLAHTGLTLYDEPSP